jgi:hypothetical protein
MNPKNDHESPSHGDRKQRKVPTVSAVFGNGGLVELVYDPEVQRTSFAVWQDAKWVMEDSFEREGQKPLVPYSPENNLIKHQVVLLPSLPEDYGSTEELVREIEHFMHRYVDVTPAFEKIASYYVLFSWLYDGFNELPYLRLRGDYGSGKTRFLLIVGSLCYKGVFASGASTVSPIFHILDSFRGTLLIDEGDFRFSDEKADIVKILNNGNVKGFPVLRCEVSRNNEFNPRAFNVFGPKIVATRGYYDDRALESRFISEEMGGHPLRQDIPINLTEQYREEALHLRNKLLLFRFRNYGKPKPQFLDRTIAPRLNQIFAPLMSVIDDERIRQELRQLAREYNRELILDRGMDIEARVLEVIKGLSSLPETKRLSIKDITESFIQEHGAEYDGPVTAKWIGTIVRRKLGLKTQKQHGVFVIPLMEKAVLERLYEKYGISGQEEPPTGDIGDKGDLPGDDEAPDSENILAGES